MQHITEMIQWFGHGSFMIQGPPIIYINPWRVVRGTFLADVILIGHDHYDHCSVADVEKLRGDTTRILGNEQVSQQIADVEIVRPWQSVSIDRASVKAVPAYSPRHHQHQRDDGGLGFVISVNLYDIYYAGDTQMIDEMRLISPDVVILPIDGDATLTVEEAVEVVKMMRPRWVIPCNWGARGEGTSEVEARRFKELVSGQAQVILLPLKGNMGTSGV